MTPGSRYHYAVMLRRARDEHTLVLAALGNVVDAGNRGLGAGAGAIATQQRELSSIAVALEQLGVAPALYGRCEICDQTIEQRRLDREPWTRRCTIHAFASRGS